MSLRLFAHIGILQASVFVFTPRRVSALAAVRIVDVACGEAHTLALDDAGALYSFGKGSSGQLGTGLVSDSMWPVRVDVSVIRKSRQCVLPV